MNQNSNSMFNRSKVIFLISLISILLALVTASLGFASSARNITASTKSVNKTTASIGESVEYTIIISNTGGAGPINSSIYMTDTLPADMQYVVGSLQVISASGTAIANTVNGSGYANGKVFWNGAILADRQVEVKFSATVSPSATVSQTIANTAMFSETGNTYTDTASFTVVSGPPPTISASTKSVDKAQAIIGEVVEYTVLISNTTTGTASGVFMTDTLPTSLVYVPNSLVVNLPAGNAITGGEGESSGEISWNGTIVGGNQVEIKYSAIVSTSATVSQTIVNTAMFAQGGGNHSDTASFIVASEPITKYVYLPIIFRALTVPSDLSSTRPVPGSNDNFTWTFSWNALNVPSGATYIVEESETEDFSTTITTYNSSSTSHTLNKAPSLDNTNYYRVRISSGTQLSDYSNVVKVIGAYRDDFSNTDGGWKKVRQDWGDADDIRNVESITSEGYYKMHVQTTDDYFSTSPLAEAPEPPYSIETRVSFEGPGNLNTYGILWGADWNGGECPRTGYPFIGPVVDGAGIDNCFNQHYYAQMTWFGGGDQLLGYIKQVDYYNDDTGINEGTGLWGVSHFGVGSDPGGWHKWVIEIAADGQTSLFHVDDSTGTRRLIRTVTASQYVNNPYFGLTAESNEYPGSDPLWDYIQVSPMP